VGQHADPDEVEVVEVQRKADDGDEHRQIVERLAVPAEGGIDVGEQRPQRDRHADFDDGPRRVPTRLGVQ
jgi:hypothetical protein